MPNPVYTSELLDSHISADQFIADGGYALYIKKPTEKTLAPYIQQLSKATTLNETLILHSLNKSTKTTEYETPELYIAFKNDGNIAAVVLFYNVEINKIQCNWVDVWSSLAEGAGSLVMFYVINQTGQFGYGVGGNAERPISITTDQSDFVFKDPATKWILMQNNELINLGKAQEPYVMQTSNFSKIYPTFAPGENPARYDFNKKIWIDTLLNPQEDYGTPPFMTPDVFYKFDTTTKTWVLNA
jgi:hypothetical protein